MPTASVEMITKLATDAKAVSAALVKMQKQVAKIDDAETAPHVTTLQTKFDRLNQQIEKIERDAGRKPPILADESDYKNCRKILTNIVKFVQWGEYPFSIEQITSSRFSFRTINSQ